MLQQQKTASGQKCLSLWQRMTLTIVMLFSGGSVIGLAPSQAVYAHSNNLHTRSTYHHHRKYKQNNKQVKITQVNIVCRAAKGGKGGYATKRSNGASGGAGGNCIFNLPITLSLQMPSEPRDTNAPHGENASHEKAPNDTNEVHEIRYR